MKFQAETVDDLVFLVAANFRTFGGHAQPSDNPISHAMRGEPAAFALGVDVRAVVDFVLANQPRQKSIKKKPKAQRAKR